MELGLRTDRRVLDPVERVSEVVFGLIMVLTFTCSLSVAQAGREEVRDVLVAALGCNLAWGIVDGAMYVLARLIARQREVAHERAAVTRQDVQGGIGLFLITFLCTFPVIIPFLFFSTNAVRALRVSNGVALTMLFLGGYALGRYSGLRPVRLGLWLTGLGVVLVAITIALGG